MAGHANFRAYGLRIAADRAIPGLIPIPATSAVDIQIRLGSMPPDVRACAAGPYASRPGGNRHAHGRPEAVSWTGEGGQGYRLRYDDGTTFVIGADGGQVWATWPATMSLDDAVYYLMGSVLTFVLRLRGTSCLHGSAFSTHGRVVALLGASGAGKSTTAAAFAERGFAVLTDDVLALEEGCGHVLAHPGYPRLRLWPDAASFLYGGPVELPRLTPNWDKRYIDLLGDGYAFERQVLPLSAIYVLDERRDGLTSPLVESLTRSAALLAILRNVRGDVHVDKEGHRREFDLLGRIVQSVPIRRVTPCTASNPLSMLCDAILGDLHADFQRADIGRMQICTI